jgi:hypothetical protein
MKKFIGYFIIGAANYKDAFNEKGLLLWSTKKPNVIVRYFNRILLNILWINKTKVLEEKGIRENKETNTQMYKVAPPKKNNNYEKPHYNTRRSPKSNRGEA